MLSLARGHELSEHFSHTLEMPDPTFDVVELGTRFLLDRAARGSSFHAQPEQLQYLLEGEAEILRLLDELDPRDRFGTV